MDPNEIIKAAPEIAKGAAALGAAIPFTGIVKRMLGPAADELAEMWRDQVRLYRYGRQLKCVEKAERMAEKAGFTPQAVPPKILFPLLEGASFEEDESLHDMWASLLANAASPNHAAKIRPAFIDILKQMVPDEAVLLKWLLAHTTNRSFELPDPRKSAYSSFVDETQNTMTPEYFRSCLDGLDANRLIRLSELSDAGYDIWEELRRERRRNELLGVPSTDSSILTQRGFECLDAVRPPTPKK